MRALARAGALQPRVRVRWSWLQGGRPVGAIATIKTADALIVDYQVQTKGEGPMRPMRERVALDWTPCRYGGSRPWFRCPNCGSRRAILFCVGGRFRCRICHDLVYASTWEDPADRARRRADKARRKLGGDDSGRWVAVPAKPPRMRSTTYEQLVDRIVMAEQNALATWTADAEKLLARLNHRLERKRR